ncbi:MAG: hypothetical protein ABUL42_01255 [Terricaulis silvestris]
MAMTGTQRAIERDYIVGTLICGAIYLALTVGAKLTIRGIDPHGLLLIALALAPTVAFVGFFTVFARYLKRIDEYRRHRMVQSLLICLAIGLSVMSGLDFLQAYGGIKPPEPFILTSGFMLLFGVVNCGLSLIDARRAGMGFTREIK